MAKIEIKSIPVNANVHKLKANWKSVPVEIYRMNGTLYVSPQSLEDARWKQKDTKRNWLLGKNYPFRNKVCTIKMK